MSDNPEKEVVEEKPSGTLRSSLLKPMDEFTPGIPLFIGTLKEQHAIIYKTAQAWMGHVDSLEGGRTKEAQRLLNIYNELREKHFKDTDEIELKGMLTNYFNFFFRSLDRACVRNETIDFTKDKNFVNTYPGKGTQQISTVQPARPPSADASMSARERMRKTFLRASGSPDSFTVLLRNSLVLFKIKIPTPLQLIHLINDIVTKLRQYGERFNLTSLHLERAGVGEIITDFCLDNLTYHSVKGVTDPYELKRVILANDLGILAQTLLAVSSPKGVNFRMYCLAGSCKLNENWLVDAGSMIHHVEDEMSPERRELLYSLSNGTKLSIEEIKEARPIYMDKEGKELDTVIPFYEGRGRLIVEVPTLDVYFNCFNRMADMINPALRKLAVDFPSAAEYEKKRSEHLSGIRMGEYLQYFSRYELDPEVGEEGETVIEKRETDPASFDEGLIDIFNIDDQLYADALKRVVEICPMMTYSYVGILDIECPSCKKRAEGIQDTKLASITPIDPILNFIDHTRMMIGIRAEVQSLEEENLS